MQEYEVEELLESLEAEETKTIEFSKSLLFFSKNPNVFIRGFQKYGDNDRRWDIYNKLFLFLPITKDIIKMVVDERFFTEDNLIIEGEELFLKDYFKNLKYYREFLEKNGLKIEKLKREVRINEKKFQDLEERNKELNRSKDEKNQVISKRNNLMKELNVEKTERINKVEAKVKRYYDKLKALEEFNE
jgi:hypothetical protein